MSRVALSHVEANLSVPSERTVTLLAGVFALEPPELAAATDYPPAKADRLPLVTARHTEVEHQLAVLAAILDVIDVIDGVPPPERERLARDVRHEWRDRLRRMLDRTADADERRRLRTAIRDLVPDP
jgi:hypothetical protein